jgi:prepilin-type N-terminal cleavage/methylation domain-containing protein
MKARTRKKNNGFTLIELMVTIFIATIVLFAIGVVLADSHRGWWRMWERENEGIVPNAYVARKTFDGLVRQATIRRQLVDGEPYETIGNTSLRVYYYSAPADPIFQLDRYATLRLAGSTLVVDYGDLQPGTWEPQGDPGTMVLAEDVEAVEFTVQGNAIRMELTLETGRQTMTVAVCAYRHNDHNVH